MLFPQARRVSPRTVLLRRKITPRDRNMFTTSVAAALIHRALVRKPRKAKSQCSLGGSLLDVAKKVTEASAVPTITTTAQTGRRPPIS